MFLTTVFESCISNFLFSLPVLCWFRKGYFYNSEWFLGAWTSNGNRTRYLSKLLGLHQLLVSNLTSQSPLQGVPREGRKLLSPYRQFHVASVDWLTLADLRELFWNNVCNHKKDWCAVRRVRWGYHPFKVKDGIKPFHLKDFQCKTETYYLSTSPIQILFTLLQ